MEDNDTIDVYQEQVCLNRKKYPKYFIDLFLRLVVHVKQENLDHHFGSQFYLE
jgi:hypothetical protein